MPPEQEPITLHDLATADTELRPQHIRDKLAFLIYSQELLYHFEPVLRRLDPAEVDLIVYTAYPTEALETRLAELPYAWYDGRQLVRERIGYRLLVSVHVSGLETLRLHLRDGRQLAYQGYPFRLLGEFNLRYFFSLGADDWNFQSWNLLYDAFFCFGPYQARRLSGFKAPKFLMGYPRYDAFFTAPLTAEQRRAALERFGCDPARPTVLWLRPLLDHHPGLPAFAGAVSELMPAYNVLVKPHPYHSAGNRATLELLGRYRFSRLITDSIDNLQLFQLSDFVICEYGGPPFAALYTDQNLLLFDHPDYRGQATADPLTSDTDQWLRRHLPHLLPEQAGQLPEMLANQSLWATQREVRRQLRELYFASNYGHSAETAAILLPQLLKLARRYSPSG